MQQVAVTVNLDWYAFARDNESVMERFQRDGSQESEETLAVPCQHPTL